MLDAMLLERAARGGHYVPGRRRPVPGPETMDTELGCTCSACAAGRRGSGPGGRAARRRRASEKEVTESILAKLDVLDRRLKLKRAEVRKLKSRKDVAAAASGRDRLETEPPGRQLAPPPPRGERSSVRVQ